ncbi:hypothetical protein [Winogradskyella wichelsiae]|uniref:hypothetical protein n=1 Tax=Winogradskyella wichelsiae TaxID=2697007 RepID=UPI0015CD7036|nr:hypothetical protein [Winogradskyella wichelsiae]
MKIKLHFFVLAVLLALIGTYIEHYTVPNQQIVIQFSDKDISSEDSENAIVAIQNKLENIGVSQIQIGENNQGTLRIIYHSDADVEDIQHALFNVEDLTIAYNSSHNKSHNLPDSKHLKNYEINISEIKTNNNTDWDFNGTQVVEVNQKTDRLSYFKIHSSGFYNQNSIHNYDIKISVVIVNDLTTAIHNVSYIIPEVRAGPTA